MANQAIQELKAECEAAGSATAWAKAHGFSASFVNDVLAKRRPASKRLLTALGLEKVQTVEYRKVK